MPLCADDFAFLERVKELAKYDGTIRIDTHLDNKGLLSGLKNLGKLMAGALTAAATALGGIGAAVVNVGMDFEAQMSRVQAISGAVGNDFTNLTQLAKQLGAETSFSALEAAEGMENLASAGFDVTEIMEAMPGLLDLAAVSGGDVAAASEVAASALNAFGLEASEVGHVADVFAKAAADTNAETLDMGEAMKYVAPVAKSMGISLEETAAAIGIMSDAGVKGSQAGTTLRGALSRLAKPTKVMRDKMDELGISFYDAQGNMLPLEKQVAILQNKFKGLTQEEQNNALVTLYGQESLSGMLALIEAGPDKLNELTTSFENADGAAAEMAATMRDNLAGDVESLTGSLETLGIALYEGLNAPMRDVVQQADSYMAQLQEAFNTGGFDGFVGSLGDVLSQAVTSIVSYAPQMVDAAFSLLQSFGSGLMNNSSTLIDSGMSMVNTLLTGIVNALPGMASAAIQLIAQLGNAIIAEIPKIAELGGQLLDNLSSGIKNGFGDFINNGLDLIEGFADSLTENLPILLQKGCEMLQNLAQGIADALPTLIARVPEIISKFANLINDNVPTILKTGINIIITLVKGIIQAIPTLVANIPKIISAIVDVWSAFNWIQLGKNAITFLKDGIKSMFGAIKGAGKNILDGITGALKNLPNTLKNLGKNAIDFLKSGISGMKSKAVSAAKGILDAVVSSIKTLPDKMLSIGKNIVQGLWDGIKDMTKWITDKVKSFAGSVLGGIKKALGINSPSKVTRGYGEFLAEGLSVGFEKSMPHVQRSLLSDIKSMTGKMQAVVALENSKIALNAQQGGKVNNSSVTNHTTNHQNLNFYQPIQTPSQIARAARKAQEVTG